MRKYEILVLKILPRRKRCKTNSTVFFSGSWLVVVHLSVFLFSRQILDREDKSKVEVCTVLSSEWSRVKSNYLFHIFSRLFLNMGWWYPASNGIADKLIGTVLRSTAQKPGCPHHVTCTVVRILVYFAARQLRMIGRINPGTKPPGFWHRRTNFVDMNRLGKPGALC